MTVLIIAVRTSFAITAIAWSKTSFAITLLRLIEGWMNKLVWFILITTNLALGAAALIPWIQCKPLATFWDISVPGTCWNPKIVYYIYIVPGGAYSAVMDFVLAILPWKLLWHLTMRPKEKIGIAITMSMGILYAFFLVQLDASGLRTLSAGVTAIVKTSMLLKLFSGDIYDGVQLVIWDVAESAVTIIAASIPALRVLLRDARSSRDASHPSDPQSVNTLKTPRHWKNLSILPKPFSKSSKHGSVEDAYPIGDQCELVSKST